MTMTPRNGGPGPIRGLAGWFGRAPLLEIQIGDLDVIWNNPRISGHIGDMVRP